MPSVARSARTAAVAALACLAGPAALAQTAALEVTDAANARLLFLDTAAALTAHGTLDAGAIPATGPGTRLMWWPARSAFRAGTVDGTRWDLPNVGVYSVATGLDAQASGPSSTAMGAYTIASGASSTALGDGSTASGTAAFAAGFGAAASGLRSVAMGWNTQASGDGATAMGVQTVASAFYSTAMGLNTRATGDRSTAMGSDSDATGSDATAMGFSTTASGVAATAMGYQSTASGDVSVSIGFLATASGNASVALGSAVSTEGFEGAFVLGDYSTIVPNLSYRTRATAANQFSARFAGGYRLLTAAFSTTAGVTLGPGQSSWASASDSTLKERFRAYDPDAVLAGLRGLRLGTWNYRGQDPATMRHWGPMAQDFHRAFGRDGVGVIGTDTTISTQDADGVLFAAAQALEARTRDLEARIESLEAERGRERTLGGLAVAGLLGVGFVGAARRRRAA